MTAKPPSSGVLRSLVAGAERLLSRKRGTVILIVLAGLVAVLLALGLGWNAARSAVHGLLAQPPRVGMTVLAPGASKAMHALESGLPMSADERAATEYLAAQPTAYWLTPEQDPRGTVGPTVSGMLAQARTDDAALAVVVYGLPERDCGNHSAGGLPTNEYLSWVQEIAAALAVAPDVEKIVILEPDSLALAPSCGNLGERIPQLRAAVEELAGPATWIYLDGGHSGWLPAEQMAGLIAEVGVSDEVRGFATNVSNYRSSSDEFAYARAVSAQLGGLHAIIDTSRNGAATAGSGWCNPPGQRVGEPTGTFGDDVVDTNLWVKPPGESDGPCHGGPAPGAWWPEGAAALTAGVR